MPGHVDEKRGCKDEKRDRRRKGPSDRQKKKLNNGLLEYMRRHVRKTHRAKQ